MYAYCEGWREKKLVDGLYVHVEKTCWLIVSLEDGLGKS